MIKKSVYERPRYEVRPKPIQRPPIDPNQLPRNEAIPQLILPPGVDPNQLP